MHYRFDISHLDLNSVKILYCERYDALHVVIFEENLISMTKFTSIESKKESKVIDFY